jgi:A/G-specific adenine glycosylase
MLQQTRVESVIEYYHRFLARFPSPAALATAPSDDVMSLWAGLGYYARARNLQKAAQQVVERHDGEVPDDPTAFLALAGVGRYTCGAVQSIAFGHRLPVLDGNVIRVLCRVDAVESDPREKRTNDILWSRAAELADGDRPGDLNQALMELGALICTPRSPSCDDCPITPLCSARASGDPARIPIKPKRKTRPHHTYQAALCRDDADRIVLGRRPTDGLLGGLWSLPMVEGDTAATLDHLSLSASAEDLLATIKHGFTHQVWTVALYASAGQPSGGPFESWRAFTTAELATIALAGPSLKALRAAGVDLPHRRGAGPRPRSR